MENVKVKPPKIRHKDGRKDRSLVRAVTKPFVERLVKEFERQVEEIGVDQLTGRVSDHMLLTNRRCLIALIKAGMHERRDLEVEIAAQAMVVWWLRQSKEERTRLEESGMWT